MRKIVPLITLVLFSALAFSEDLFVYEGNFLELPNYKEIEELNSVPPEAECADASCSSFIFDEKRFFRADLLTSENYKSIVIGTWTGGDCSNDRWEMRSNGQFRSQFPQDDGIYSWSGKYTFTDSIYIEDASNNDQEKEWNEAKLFYLPKYDVIIYKGTRSLDGFDENGDEIYKLFEGPDLYYFRRCRTPHATP